MKLGFRCSEGGTNFQDAITEVTFAEEVGFDSVWVAEHHGWEVIWPSSHMALAGLATRTDTIELGTSITLLPQVNPVRLAGEANLIDQISEGRFTLGVGVGWRQDEMENLGYDFETRGPRMTEHLEVLHTLWENDSASYDGQFISFEDFELSPPSVQEPHPEIWVGGGVDQALQRAAFLGDAWFPVWLPGIDDLSEQYNTYEKYVEEAGKDVDNQSRPILRNAWIAEDSQTAKNELQNLFDDLLQKYRDGGAGIPTAMQEAVRGDFDDFAEGRFIYGTPEECVEDIEQFENELGIDHIVLKLYNPSLDHDQMMKFIELFGDEVIPELS